MRKSKWEGYQEEKCNNFSSFVMGDVSMCEYEKPKVSTIIESMINHVRAIQVEEHKLQRFHEYEYNTIRINQPFFNGLRALESHIHMLVNCNQEQKREEKKNG